MIKKIIITVILIAGLNFVYKNVLDPYLTTFKDDKFDTYDALKENKVESENYKIRKLDIKMYEIESIQYDSVTSNYIVASKAGARSLWKVNKFGVLIDSIVGEEGRGKKVVALLDEDGFDYSGWIVSSDKEDKKFHLAAHKTKTVGVYSSKYGEGPAYLHYNEKPPIELQHFTKKTRSRKALFSFNPTGSRTRNGWNGIGYFEWNYKSDKFYFKTDAFDSFGSYQLDIEISTIEEQKKNGLIFLYLRKRSMESALYVVSPKNNSN